MAVLTGLGGIGKSEVARKFAQIYSTKFGSATTSNDETDEKGGIQNGGHAQLGWINAANFSSLKNSFKLMGQSLGLPAAMEAGDWSESHVVLIARQIYAELSDKEELPSLFIFDNAEQFLKTTDDTFGILPFLPRQTYAKFPPQVLVTSRNKKWGSPGEAIEIFSVHEGLSENETILYFRTYFPGTFHPVQPASANDDNDEDPLIMNIKKIHQFIGGFPLALTLAAAFINENGFGNVREGVLNYIQILESEHADSWQNYRNADGTSDYRLIMKNVWSSTYKRISEHPAGLDALGLVNHLAYLDPDNLNVRTVAIAYFKIFILDDQDIPQKDHLTIRTTLVLLEKYSMITVRIKNDPNQLGSTGMRENSVIRIHRVVQKCSRDWQRAESRTNTGKQGGGGGNSALMELAGFMDQFRHTSLLQYHTEHLHKALKECQWPGTTIRLSTFWAVQLSCDFLNPREHVLEDVRAYLTNSTRGTGSHGDELCAVYLALIYWNHFTWASQQQRGVSDEDWTTERILDNSSFVQDPSHPLYTISVQNLANWILSEMTSRGRATETETKIIRKGNVSTVDYAGTQILNRLLYYIQCGPDKFCEFDETTIQNFAEIAAIYGVPNWGQIYFAFVRYLTCNHVKCSSNTCESLLKNICVSYGVGVQWEISSGILQQQWLNGQIHHNQLFAREELKNRGVLDFFFDTGVLHWYPMALQMLIGFKKRNYTWSSAASKAISELRLLALDDLQQLNILVSRVDEFAESVHCLLLECLRNSEIVFTPMLTDLCEAISEMTRVPDFKKVLRNSIDLTETVELAIRREMGQSSFRSQDQIDYVIAVLLTWFSLSLSNNGDETSPLRLLGPDVDSGVILPWIQRFRDLKVPPTSQPLAYHTSRRLQWYAIILHELLDGGKNQCDDGPKPMTESPSVSIMMTELATTLQQLIFRQLNAHDESTKWAKWEEEEEIKHCRDDHVGDSVIHSHIQCDGCATMPIQGTRYKCKLCPDFDFCKICMDAGFHEHTDFHTMDTPMADPIWRHGQNGSIPEGSLICGKDEKGACIFLAQFYVPPNSTVVGGLTLSSGLAFGAYKSRACASQLYRTLIMEPDAVRWIESGGGKILAGAIVGGELWGNAVYIGRVVHKQRLVVGTVIPWERGILVPDGIRSTLYAKYEILVRCF